MTEATVALIFPLVVEKLSKVVESSGKTIAILGDRQTAKEEGKKICCNECVTFGRNVLSARIFGGVSVRSRNGAPSRKGCVVNGQVTKASNK